MSRILVTGASSGLGATLLSVLQAHDHDVEGYSLTNGENVLRPDLSRKAARLQLDVLINCAGVNEINWLQDVSEEEWDSVVDTNVKGIFLMTQHCLPLLRASRGTVLNIVSNAAHIPMRCSAAYNASKGGALALTKQLARELAPHITVFSVSPNKLRGTAMSSYIERRVLATRGWSPEKAREYQLAAMLTGEETPPVVVAEFIAYLLSSKERHKYLAGCDISYGA